MEAQLYLHNLYAGQLSPEEVAQYRQRLGDNAFSVVSLGNRLVLILRLP